MCFIHWIHKEDYQRRKEGRGPKEEGGVNGRTQKEGGVRRGMKGGGKNKEKNERGGRSK